MNRFPICECHDAEDPATQFRDSPPVAHAAIRLDFLSDGIRDDALAPIPLEVRPLAENLFFEIPRRFQGAAIMAETARQSKKGFCDAAGATQ